MWGDYPTAMDYSWGPLRHTEKNKMFRKDIGVGVAEIEGKIKQVMDQKMKLGAKSMEIQLGGRNAADSGAETHGKEVRDEIKRMAEVNEVDIQSVHAPSYLTGFSGWDARQGQFNEEQAAGTVDEIKSAIDFAADVTHGGSVVVHLGEFPRPVDQIKGFEDYEGSAYGQAAYFADKKSGKVQQLPRDYKVKRVARRDDEGHQGEIKLDDNGIPIIEEVTWYNYKTEFDRNPDAFKNKYFEEELQANKPLTGDIIARALFKDYFKSGIEDLNAEIEQHIGRRDEYKSGYNELKDKTKDNVAAEITAERVRSREPAPNQDEIDRAFNKMENARKMYQDRMAAENLAIAAQLKKKKDTEEAMDNIVPISEVALTRSADNLAKLGIYAMQQTQAHKLDRPLTITAENLAANMYGGKVEDVMDILDKARQAFVDRLSEKEIPDPTGAQEGKIRNPYYDKSFAGEEGKKKALEIAKKHIKTTLDFQHLGMWQKHFVLDKENLDDDEKKLLKQGDYEGARKHQFDKWYLEQVNTLAAKGDYIGNLHIVDGMGRAHVHLPMGQGQHLISDALLALREKGIDVPMTSEGWLEGPERQLLESWSQGGEGGKTIYHSDSGPVYWNQLNRAYMGTAIRPPDYLLPGTVTDKEAFGLGTDVPID